jgi:cytochrome P450/NADPH-cytochrome P450 reductase
MLPPMRIRQYSISSSPLKNPSVASLTFSVLSVPGFQGVASTYLKGLEEGDVIHVAVKPTILFTLPEDVENTPVVMIGAGAGVAPFRGFLQEREQLRKENVKIAPAYLFVGCRSPDSDLLFPEEIEQWEQSRLVKVFYAFSREQERSKGCKYVQERLWEERKEIGQLVRGNAKILVCGGQKVGDGVKEVVKRIYGEELRARGEGTSTEKVEKWFEGLKGEGRWAMDVFD